MTFMPAAGGLAPGDPADREAGIIAGSILVFVPSLGAYVTPRVLGGASR